MHLRGEKIVGVYPLLPDNTCRFLAFDCDGKNWSQDSRALLTTLQSWNLPGYRERSRSGDGAHIWLFFSEPVLARQARALGSLVLTKTMESRPELGLGSYDRMFPNQDWMPEGGFGNLIALPLQKAARSKENSVFIDDSDHAFPDQWDCLARVVSIPLAEVLDRIRDHAKDGDLLGVEDVSVEEEKEDRWSQISRPSRELFHAPPVQGISSITKVVLRLDGEVSVPLYDEDGGVLPSALKNRLIRLAAFPNPDFYQAQRLRLNLFQIPRIIGCGVEQDGWLKLPRGLQTLVQECLQDFGVEPQVLDERNQGHRVEISFAGTLLPEQQDVMKKVLAHDTGVLCAPTGFGKTVLACSILAARKVNTLILVHRGQLMDQWKSQMQALLELTDASIGTFGKGKKKPGGQIDIATIQSLFREKSVDPMVKNYGQIIVDECHHVSAFSFEQIHRSAPACYVLGLTATPIRRDGLHPIMFMQCGPMRVKVKRQNEESSTQQVVVWKEVPNYGSVTTEMAMTELYAALTADSKRTDLIVDDIVEALAQGRFPLVLTERKAHLDQIEERLKTKTAASIAVPYGGQGKKIRAKAMSMITEKGSGPRVLLATGKLIGEGFDLPDLDTLFIVLPISWRGTLQQYVGRLTRNLAQKSSIRVHDYFDPGHPILLKMSEKRRVGYRALGFKEGAAVG